MTRVLIADDHEVVRRGLKQILADAFAPVKVVEAHDSHDTVQKITETAFDLVLLDINMPGRSGLEVLAEIRRQRPETPVLVISASPEEDYALRCIKLGASGYINKQSASDELVSAVKKALAGGKYVTASVAEKLAESFAGGSQSTPHESLSNRELQVLRLIATGKTVKEIASDLCLSEKTIATYRARISDKMRLASNVDLTRYAIQHGLTD